METLELKNVLPYLDSEIMVLEISRGKFVGDNDIKKIDILSIKDTNRVLTKRYRVKSCKLILVPMSDLNRQESIYRENIRNIDDLSKWLYEQEPESFNNIDGAKKWINSSISLESGHIENLPYKIVSKLIEWHYDIFGLIEKGLAVDINTLEDK